MSVWKCDSFNRKERVVYYWIEPVENCGLCKNWNGKKCVFHEELKELGDNEGYEETDSDDYGFSRVNTEWDEWGGYGKPD